MTYQKSKFRSPTKVHSQREGLGLIEVLIGLTVTLIVLGAMAGAFRFASQQMAKGRASLELTNRLRTVENLLRSDLRRLTVELKPYHRLPATPEGYAEIIDGPLTDVQATTLSATVPNDNLLLGDFDDVLAGTIRAIGRPFRGRYLNGIQESHLAEVAWFTTYSDDDGDGLIEPNIGEGIRLYRRQLVIKPSLGILGAFTSLGAANQFIQNNDVSCRVEDFTAAGGAPFRVTANSLQDLAQRRNRFAHNFGVYPQTAIMNLTFLLSDRQYLLPDNNTPANYVHRRASDQSDLLLSDIAAFDVRVFAQNAQSQTDASGDFVAGATELGWRGGTALGASSNRIGDYVDLGKGGTAGVLLQNGMPTTAAAGGRPALTYLVTQPVFDTGTSFYDRTTAGGAIPVGSNGIDDNTNGAVDEDAEKIAAPYNTPIRGLEVIVRLYEPNSGQASQVTMRQSMVPQ